MSKIRLDKLIIFANHGVFPEEKSLGQKFIVSADLILDTNNAAKNDDLTQSVHYGEVAHTMTRFLQENTFDLIETCAHRLAEHILRTYPKLDGIRLILEKPWAPIGLALETVSIQVDLAWTPVAIALGSNLGDRQAYLQFAQDALQDQAGLRNFHMSSILETEPVSEVAQGPFLNAVCIGESLLSPMALLTELHHIENQAQRERTLHWGPRTLDLDLLYYGETIQHDPALTLPHPRLQDRFFVLEPLCEIAPNWVDPRYHVPVSELLKQFKKEETYQH